MAHSIRLRPCPLPRIGLRVDHLTGIRSVSGDGRKVEESARPDIGLCSIGGDCDRGEESRANGFCGSSGCIFKWRGVSESTMWVSGQRFGWIEGTNTNLSARARKAHLDTENMTAGLRQSEMMVGNGSFKIVTLLEVGGPKSMAL